MGSHLSGSLTVKFWVRKAVSGIGFAMSGTLAAVTKLIALLTGTGFSLAGSLSTAMKRIGRTLDGTGFSFSGTLTASTLGPKTVSGILQMVGSLAARILAPKVSGILTFGGLLSHNLEINQEAIAGLLSMSGVLTAYPANEILYYGVANP